MLLQASVFSVVSCRHEVVECEPSDEDVDGRCHEAFDSFKLS